MFTKEELNIIFDVFSSLESEDKDVLKLKEKMSLLKEQIIIGDEANKKITELQDKIQDLMKEDSKKNES